MDSASSTCLLTARWCIAVTRLTPAPETRSRAKKDLPTSASTLLSRAQSAARRGTFSTVWRAWEAT